MSELNIIERNENITTSDELLTNVIDDLVTDDVITDDVITDDADLNTEELAPDANTSDQGLDGDAGGSEDIINDEGFVDEFTDYLGEGMDVDSGYEEGMYVDSGMGMEEVKDPLLSSWPFVIGISAAVLLVSIAVGVLLAKLRIKKGIDLYED